MAEVKGHKIRRAMIEAVSSFDDTIVRKAALENSELFKEFLEKEIVFRHGEFDEFDFKDVVEKMEEKLDLVIPDRTYATWRTLFDQINLIMY